MKNYFNVIKNSPLFYEIEEENIFPMLACIGAHKKEYKKNQIIFREGENISSIGIVLKGKVQLSKYGYSGNKSIITTINNYEMFGESFASAGVKLPVDVISIEDSIIMFIDINRILKSCSNACSFHNKMISNLLKAVAIKNVILNKKIEIISKRTTREKLLTYLYLKSKEEGKLSFTIPYDRQSLADYLEVDRSGLSMEISKLCKEEVIECKKNYFVLKKQVLI